MTAEQELRLNVIRQARDEVRARLRIDIEDLIGDLRAALRELDADIVPSTGILQYRRIDARCLAYVELRNAIRVLEATP